MRTRAFGHGEARPSLGVTLGSEKLATQRVPFVISLCFSDS